MKAKAKKTNVRQRNSRSSIAPNLADRIAARTDDVNRRGPLERIALAARFPVQGSDRDFATIVVVDPVSVGLRTDTDYAAEVVCSE